MEGIFIYLSSPQPGQLSQSHPLIYAPLLVHKVKSS